MEKTVQNIPFLRITVALAIGVIIGIQPVTDVKLYFIVAAAILAFLFVVNKFYRFSFNLAFGLGANILFILLGIIVTNLFNRKPVFYDKGEFVAVVLEKPQEKPNSYSTLIRVEEVHFSDSVKVTSENVIVYFEKSVSVKDLNAGEVILFGTIPQFVENNRNPYEFDYKNYLAKKRVYRQVYISTDQWIKTGYTEITIFTRAELIREKLLQIYRNQPIDETEFEILSALTLGYKRELDPETKRVFSASGASHVLAVSGLHVGIVFWVVSLIFGFLRKGKNGRIFFVLISVILLWSYAFITGLSPSVMRASLMFSIYVIGENIGRKSNIYNSMAASAFILLLINPNSLFDAGFQLSYAAVFGIVFLQPRLERQITVKNKILKYFWSLLTVSISAQVATFPITSYYFGQFPGYFWLTNMFVIPAVMALIPLGISLLLLSKVSIISNLIAMLLNLILKITYFLLSSIDQLPFSVLEISVNQIELILILALIIAIFIYLADRKVIYIKAFLFFVLLLLINNLVSDINRLNNTELIVYNNSKNLSFHLIHGKENYVFSEEKADETVSHPSNYTRKKLGLNPTIFLSPADTVFDNNIIMKNNLICFNDKIISFNSNINKQGGENQPDFIINPVNLNDLLIDNKEHTIIITHKRYFNKSSLLSDRIHCTYLDGAYRKNW